jgi:hypothetical protein
MIRRCMLTTRQLTDEYFLENRNRLLDIAAFLDRLERSSDGEEPDFRVRAFREALRELLSDEPGRARRVHLILSDPTAQPRERLDCKAAFGAYNSALEVRS